MTYFELNKCLIIFWQQIEYLVIVRHLGTIKVQLTLERESNVAEIKSQRRNSVPTRKGRGVALKDLSLSNIKYDSTIKCQSIQLTPTVFSVWPSVLVNESKFLLSNYSLNSSIEELYRQTPQTTVLESTDFKQYNTTYYQDLYQQYYEGFAWTGISPW